MVITKRVNIYYGQFAEIYYGTWETFREICMTITKDCRKGLQLSCVLGGSNLTLNSLVVLFIR